MTLHPSSCAAARRSRQPRRSRWSAGIIVSFIAASGWLAFAQQTSPPPQGQAASPPATGQSAPPATGGQQTPPSRPASGQTPPAGQPASPNQAPNPNQPASTTPQFRTGINFVRVDVLVSDKKGAPVVDLTQEDFEVFEDNKPQKVESFKLMKVDGNAPEGETPREIRSDYVLEAEAAREDTRLFAIYLDDYHVRRGASMAVRQPLIKFLRTLGPMDLVGVALPLTPFSAIPFTRNHDSIIRIIEKFDGRKYDYKPTNDFEEQYAYYPVETVERIRNQVSLSGLRALVTGLGTLREGRKSVIVVSEGYTNYVPPQLRDANAQFSGSGNPNRGNPFAGENDMNEDRARFFTMTDMLTDLREVFNDANRSNTALYTLDPRGLAVFEHDINEGVGMGVDKNSLQETQDTLRTLADETDGRAIVNQNDMESGLKQMVRDASAYYLIGYSSSQAPTDGRFHAIKVRVKRPGTQIRARKGYWALNNEEMTKALAPPKPEADPAVTRALAETEAPSRARIVRTWIGTSRAENGKTAVTLVWEPVPPEPGAAGRREPPTRVSVLASGSNGSFFRGKVPDGKSGAAAGAVGGVGNGGNGNASGSGNGAGGGAVPAAAVAPGAATGSGATGGAASMASAGAGGAAPGTQGGRVTFDVAPGPLQLKLSVEGSAGQVLDSDFRDMVVPDYSKMDASLSEAAVFRARTQRDLQAYITDPKATPTAAREFSRTERLLIRFNAYAPGGVAAPAGRLLNRDGNKMVDLVVKPFAEGGDSTYQLELPLASLPVGNYLIEVSLPGDAKVKELIGFRITG
jgi:VWFA-related protein